MVIILCELPFTAINRVNSLLYCLINSTFPRLCFVFKYVDCYVLIEWTIVLRNKTLFGMFFIHLLGNMYFYDYIYFIHSCTWHIYINYKSFLLKSGLHELYFLPFVFLFVKSLLCHKLFLKHVLLRYKSFSGWVVNSKEKSIVIISSCMQIHSYGPNMYLIGGN